jgi:hypothetical protein
MKHIFLILVLWSSVPALAQSIPTFTTGQQTAVDTLGNGSWESKPSAILCESGSAPNDELNRKLEYIRATRYSDLTVSAPSVAYIGADRSGQAQFAVCVTISRRQ